MNHTVMYQFKTTREEPQLTSIRSSLNVEPKVKDSRDSEEKGGEGRGITCEQLFTYHTLSYNRGQKTSRGHPRSDAVM